MTWEIVFKPGTDFSDFFFCTFLQAGLWFPKIFALAAHGICFCTPGTDPSVFFCVHLLAGGALNISFYAATTPGTHSEKSSLSPILLALCMHQWHLCAFLCLCLYLCLCLCLCLSVCLCVFVCVQGRHMAVISDAEVATKVNWQGNVQGIEVIP